MAFHMIPFLYMGFVYKQIPLKSWSFKAWIEERLFPNVVHQCNESGGRRVEGETAE